MRYKLDDWQTKASVRNLPNRLILAEENEQGKVFFPVSLVPIVQHKKVLDLGESAVQKLLVLGLYEYLNFTTILELGLVSPVIEKIALRQLGFDLPRCMHHDAIKIMTDEGYHAYQSDDMIQQVEAVTGIDYSFPKSPLLFYRLKMILDKIPLRHHDLTKLFFVIISETLISSILSTVPKDKTVISAVREIVADHASDEARHHAFFADLLQYLYPLLSEEEKSIIEPILPSLICTFLEPDLSSPKTWLTNLSLSTEDIDQIINDSYPSEHIAAHIRKVAAPTLRLFRETKVLDNSATLDAFYQSNLITEQSDILAA
jgi:P-aminobenzoate N-oxygenase AurF